MARARVAALFVLVAIVAVLVVVARRGGPRETPETAHPRAASERPAVAQRDDPGRKAPASSPETALPEPDAEQDPPAVPEYIVTVMGWEDEPLEGAAVAVQQEYCRMETLTAATGEALEIFFVAPI